MLGRLGTYQFYNIFMIKNAKQIMLCFKLYKLGYIFLLTLLSWESTVYLAHLRNIQI